MGMRIPANYEKAAEVAELVVSLARRIRRLGAAELSPLGVTHSRLRALRQIARIGEPVRMGQLALALEVVPRSATSIVDELEAQGWVRRSPDPGDRRATLVGLTPTGRRVLADADQARYRAGTKVLAEMDPAELDELERTLRGVLGEVGAEKDGLGRSRP